MEENTPIEVIEPKYPSEMDLLYPGEEALEMELDYYDDEKQEDKLWQARTGLDYETLCGALETVIFMSDRPVGLVKMKKLIDEDMPLRVLHECITRLQEEYESKHHGLRLVEVAEGYQFRTKATYSKYVQDLFKVNQLILSPTALEVLAIIAYKQPVAKTEVDKIRGVDSSHIVRGLMDKRLVRVVGRSDEVGRPVLYGTTPEFLEVFNLADLSQLPPESEIEEMVEQGVGKIADIKTLVHTGDKERFRFDEIDELDDLADTIKSIAADTDFTMSLKVEDKKRKNEAGETVKSAFDLLEEYVNSSVISEENKAALESELLAGATFPQVISDLTAGPFNVPEEEDEEDFQMIDLETGLPIEEEEVEVATSGDELLGEDLLEPFKEEREELAKALDDAFAKLTAEAVPPEMVDGELSLNDSRIDERERNLDELTDEIASKAHDLDLDLSFLNENENSTEGPSDTEQ